MDLTARDLMRSPGLASLVIVVSLLSASGGAAAGTANGLQVLATEYPAIVFSEKGNATGFGSEVVNEIQRRIGTSAPIQVLPWARAYRIALKGPYVVLFPAMRTNARNSLFKWVGPLATAQTSFYALAGTRAAVASMAEARAASAVLVPRGYYSQQILEREGFNNLKEVNTPETMMRMLLHGRAPLMVSDNITLGTLLGRVGARRQDVALQFTFTQTQGFIAFSRDVSDELVQRWQNSLDEMKRDGTFARLYQKWLPGETPPGIKPSSVFEIPSGR